LRRPFDKHIDSEELNALVSSSAGDEREPHGLSTDAVREAEGHVESCEDCTRKVSKYRQFMGLRSNTVVSKALLPGADCPKDEDIDWYEVAAGLWPELKAKQLIMHAALCDHCGPLLRAATYVDGDTTPSRGRKAAGRAEGAVAASSRPPTRAAASTTWTVHEVVGSSDAADTDCRSLSHVAEASPRSEVCRIRR